MRLANFAAIPSMVIAALVVFTMCTTAPEPVEQGTGVETLGVETADEEITEEVVEWTPEEIAAEILEALPEDWPPLSEGRVWDTSKAVLRLAEERSYDPVIVADEVAMFAGLLTDMQPLFLEGREGGAQRALLIAWDIYSETRRLQSRTCREIDPRFTTDSASVPKPNEFVMASVAFRESRFMERTEVGYLKIRSGKVQDCRWCRGARGEQGMYQFMPKGWIQRDFMPEGCNPFDRQCSIRTAVKALNFIRCLCIDEFGDRCNMDVIVGGYGLTKLPTPENARHSRGPQRARAFLCEVYDDCDTVWPRDHSDDFALSL